VAVAKNSYLEMMNATIRQPLHRDTMTIIEFEIIKRFKGIGGAVPFIVGSKGSGKTTVLHNIQEHQKAIGRAVGLVPLRVGFDEAITAAVHQVVQIIAVKMQEEKLAAQISTAHDHLRREIISGTGTEAAMRATDALLSVMADVSARLHHGIVLLVDDADAVDAHQILGITDAVQALSETGAPLPLICTTSADKRDSRWPRSQAPFRVKLSTQDVTELALSLGLNVGRDEIEIVYRQCEGNLYDATDRLQALGRHLNQLPDIQIEVPAYEVPTTTGTPIDPFRALRKSERRQQIREQQLSDPGSVE
jgi:AAA ATPase domain